MARAVASWWKGDIAAKTLTPMPDYPIEVSLQQWLEAAFFTIVLVKARGRAGAPADRRGGKAGVRSRAAATLWAFEHDLVRAASGVRPMRRGRSGFILASPSASSGGAEDYKGGER